VSAGKIDVIDPLSSAIPVSIDRPAGSAKQVGGASRPQKRINARTTITVSGAAERSCGAG